MRSIFPVSGLILSVLLAASPAAGALVPALRTPGGVSDFGTVANSPTVRLDNTMTLEAWLHPTAWRSYTGREKHGLNFMYKGRIGVYIEYVFALQENGILCLGNTWGYIGVLNRRVPLNQWTHVAVSVNETTGSWVFYINGENCGAGSGWQGASLSRTSFLGPSSHPLYIGGFNQMGWGYNNDNFIGKIADVRIWQIVRTPAEIAANYRKQLKGTEPGLAAYWTFADRLDKSPNGNHMTLTGAAACQAGQGPDLQGAGGINVALTTPTNTQIVARGTDLPLAATATSTSGVSRVDFYANNSLLGGDTEAPYQATWTNVPAGIHVLNARATNAAGQAGTSADVVIRVPGPFGDAPGAVPGRVEAEHFNYGGQNLGYNETTAANEGGKYRLLEGVDIAADAGAGNGHVVGWTKAGEWLEYTVNVTSSGTYHLEARVAAAGAGGQFRILVNGADKTGVLNVPNTGAWNAYQTVQMTNVALSAGIQTVRVAMVTAGTSGSVCAFDWFQVAVPPPSGQQPYNAAYAPWPAVAGVEFEDFDRGGTGVAYADATAANEGGQYRVGEGIDIAAQLEASNGFAVGWTTAGEWLEYTVAVPSNGTYNLEIRAANTGSGGACRMRLDGEDLTGSLAIPNTGGWNAYQAVKKDKLQLLAGTYVFRMEMEAVSSTGFTGAFDCWRLVPAGPLFGFSDWAFSEESGGILHWAPFTNQVRLLHATSLELGDWEPVTDWMAGGQCAVPANGTNAIGFYHLEHRP